MKVLFCSYNTCCQNPSGGVQNRIRKIRELLLEKGITVDFFSQFDTRVEDYDILHVFSLNHDVYDLVRFAHNKGIKVVVSPIVNVDNGVVLDICRIFINRLPFLTVRKMYFSVAKSADLLLTESSIEADYLSKHYKIDRSLFRVIPNGIDLIEYSGDEIFKLIGGKKRFVLQVGRFDENKNQLNVIRALRDKNIDVVFIGGPSAVSEKYYQKCQREAGNSDRFHFLGWIDSKSDILKSAYACADILILPSFHETFGLVALEGAMFGAKVAMSSTLPILEFPPFSGITTFNPGSIIDIRNKICDLLLVDNNKTLKKDTLSFFSWDKIAENHIKCYEELLK